MLYHTSLTIPKSIKSQIRQTGLVRPSYTQHARNRANQYDIILPDFIDYSNCRPFEIETNLSGQITKIAYRLSYTPNTQQDLILIINMHDNAVKTVWLNSVDDSHETLDMTKYQNRNKSAQKGKSQSSNKLVKQSP